MNTAQYLKLGYHGDWWSKKELALLGKLPDNEVAAMIGRTAEAVKHKRVRLGIPPARARGKF